MLLWPHKVASNIQNDSCHKNNLKFIDIIDLYHSVQFEQITDSYVSYFSTENEH